jgi:hypothetical protein
LIHPITGPALFHSVKPDSLHGEFHAHQRIQIHAGGNHIPPNKSGMLVADAQLRANFFEYFHCEKSYLAVMIAFEIEKTIALDSTPGHATNFPMLHERITPCQLAMAPKKIMSR